MKSIFPLVLLSCMALAPLAHGQGPLTPPPGPPGPTMKTLGEVEPRIALNQINTPGDATCVFRITQPGSYILTGNVKPPNGIIAILIGLLVPGVVEVDLMGFTLDGSAAGAGASGVVVNNEVLKCVVINGTIRNFAGSACLNTASSEGTLELRDLNIYGGGAGVNTAASVTMSDILVSSVTGIPVQMGSDSVLERVTIKTSAAGIPKLISGTGTGIKLCDIIISSVMSGATLATAIELGPDSVISGMSLRISDATFTGPVLSNTSGFSEVSGLGMELLNVTAPSACNSFSWGVSNPGLLNSSRGFTATDDLWQFKATNCTFTSAVVVLPAAVSGSDQQLPRITLKGTTTTPSVLRVEADNSAVTADVNVAGTATVTGAVIDVAASGTTISANIRGGNLGVRLGSGAGNTVEGCSLIALLVPAVGIQIAGGVTNSLVRNNRVARMPAGGVFVQNQGGPTNAIAPIVTSANIGSNTNPFANVQQ